jgi:type II secretory pathway predicted ATPase ExeA
MNPSFFGLNGHPFRDDDSDVEPFFADAYESLTTELNAGLKAPHGITLLIGEEGAGKTTFIRSFAERQSDNCTVAYLPTTGPGLRHLLTEVVEQLGGSVAPGANEQVLLESLRGLAKARAEHDRTTLVIIDDAHELPSKTIERLGRLFGNDPAEPSKLHVTLVGRPELLDRMNAANDRSILKHLIQVCRMDAIGPEDAFRYIADRVQKVGGLVEQVFTEDALRLIVQRSNGIPAKIDAICTAAMSEAEDHGDSSVDAETVDRACEDVDGFPAEEAAAMKDDDSEPTSYFLGDDYQSEEPMATVSADAGRDTSSHPAPVFERITADSGSRKRLAVWALGFIGVVAAIAALLSGGGQDGTVDLAATDNPVDSLVIARNDAISGGLAESGPLPTDPLSVPKLVVNREAKGAQGGASKAKDRAAAKDKEKKAQGGGKREGRGVSAGTAADAPAAARQRVTAPKFQPKAPAPVPPKTPAPSQIQAAAESSASTQAAAVAKTMQPAPKPKPTLAKPVATPTPKPAPAPVVAAPKAAPKPAAPASAKPIPPTRPAAAPAPKAAPSVAAAKPAAAAVAGGKTYTVQIGAFSSRGNAETALAKLKKTYPDGRIMVTTAGGKTVFRVVSGTFPSVPAANARAGALKQGGFSTYVRAGN